MHFILFPFISMSQIDFSCSICSEALPQVTVPVHTPCSLETVWDRQLRAGSCGGAQSTPAQAGPASKSDQVARDLLPLGLGKTQEGQSPAEAARHGQSGGEATCPTTCCRRHSKRQRPSGPGRSERWVGPCQQRPPAGDAPSASCWQAAARRGAHGGRLAG